MVSISEAALRLGVDRTTLSRAANRGTLRAVASGGIWLVSIEEVERYRRENKGRAGRKPATDAPTPPATHPIREAKPRPLVDVRAEPSEPVGRFTDLVTMPQPGPDPEPPPASVQAEPEPETPAGDSPATSPDDLLTAADAAKFIGNIERGGVWKAWKDGRLESVGEGRDRRYPRAAVEEYARRREERGKG